MFAVYTNGGWWMSSVMMSIFCVREISWSFSSLEGEAKLRGDSLSALAISKTNLFTAAVISAPVSNIESHFGTSDSGYYVTHGHRWRLVHMSTEVSLP